MGEGALQTNASWQVRCLVDVYSFALHTIKQTNKQKSRFPSSPFSCCTLSVTPSHPRTSFSLRLTFTFTAEAHVQPVYTPTRSTTSLIHFHYFGSDKCLPCAGKVYRNAKRTALQSCVPGFFQPPTPATIDFQASNRSEPCVGAFLIYVS